jgi:hypothetical protein
MFSPPALTADTQNQINCNQLMMDYDNAFLHTLSQFKTQWTTFWDPSASVDQIQSQLDYLASVTVIDLGQNTNALSAYFAKALRLITYLSGESATAFSDAVMESTGVLQPTGHPYQRYLTPGWYYTVDPSTQRIIVSGPCVWAN